MFSVMVYGPSNTLQQEFQQYSIRNLDKVDRYLSHPETAPRPNTKTAPLPVECGDTCALCERRPNQGEKALASCMNCHKVKYCNEICQRGHWTEGHKAKCNKNQGWHTDWQVDLANAADVSRSMLHASIVEGDQIKHDNIETTSITGNKTLGQQSL